MYTHKIGLQKWYVKSWASFLIKALKKHKGRRKEASSELGISERSLYRKIKEFELDDL